MGPLAHITIDVLLAVSAFLGVFDIWVGTKGGGSSTISWVLWRGAQRWPTIPFALGYLMGHLFAQMQ